MQVDQPSSQAHEITHPETGDRRGSSRLRPSAGIVWASLLSSGLLGCVLSSVPGPECGMNAYNYGGACACIANYEGDPYEACEPVMDLLITDLCDDGLDIEWRVFSEDREWVWPDSAQVFWTAGYDVDVIETLQCQEGESLCFGAVAGDEVWGLGLDGPGGEFACEDCCFDCGAYQFDLGFLTCD